jgi:hypothetical protein
VNRLFTRLSVLSLAADRSKFQRIAGMVSQNARSPKLPDLNIMDNSRNIPTPFVLERPAPAGRALRFAGRKAVI